MSYQVRNQFEADHFFLMATLPPPSTLERFAGNVATESALTIVGALAGGPLAPLLPILAKSLAAERQRVRVEATLTEVISVLSDHEEKIHLLTDEQYKLINETVLAVLQTTHDEKLQYLRAVVRNSLDAKALYPEEATILSRIVRDISAVEADFLLHTFQFKGVHLTEAQVGQESSDGILRIDPESQDALTVSGLLSLGILSPAEPTWDAPNVLRFTAIVTKLVALLQIPPA